MEPKTLQEAIVYFSDSIRCRKWIVSRRWPDGVECPRCGSKNVTFLERYNRWQCKARHQSRHFTIKTGTIFEDSPLGLDKWLSAMWQIVNDRNGISSWEIHRALGVSQKTAWFMDHRIRHALQVGSLEKMGGPENGPIEVDETFVGGRIRNMHRSKVREKYKGQPVGGYSQKAVVMGMRDRETRQVRAKVIPNVKRETLQNEILENVTKKSTVYTDTATGYYNLAKHDFVHDTVNHMEEYVRGQVHTQGIENFWSLLKRGLKGTYVAVEPFHLDRYVSEQVFRFNNRKLSDAERFDLAVRQIVGKRITFAELTGKADASLSL